MEFPSDASPASADTAEGLGGAPVTEAPTDVALPAQDANAAESSAADKEDAKAPPSLLDVVKSAVEKPAEPEAPSDLKDGQEAPKVEAEAEAPKAEAEDDTKLPFHTHPRWIALNQERDELKADATQYRVINEFMREHDLQPAEVAEGYEVMALLKSGTPESLERVLAWFEPRVAYLRQAVGIELPEDLRLKVDEGLVDEETAAELAKSRTLQANSDRQATRTREQSEAADTVERGRQLSATMANAAQGWEERIKASDPDYLKKEAFVRDAALASMAATGRPATEAETIALLDRVYAQVNKSLKDALPKPRPISPTPASSSSAPTTHAPTTMREAIAAAL